jgi:hypothetical protein
MEGMKHKQQFPVVKFPVVKFPVALVLSEKWHKRCGCCNFDFGGEKKK